MKRLLFALILLGVAAPMAGADLFFKAKRLRTGPKPCALAAADLTGDGLPEIVCANRGVMTSPGDERPANDEVSVFVAQGKLEYAPMVPLKTGFAPWDIAVANMDGLKALDLVIANFHEPGDSDLSLFLNMGPAEGIADPILFKPLTFGVAPERLPYLRQRNAEEAPLFTRPALTSVAVGDFDKDGFRDVVAAGWASDVLVYFPGEAERILSPPRIIPIEGGPRDLALADFNGDGKLDVAAALYSSSEVAVLEGDGLGGFETAERFESRGSLPHQIRSADLNGDGLLDLAVSHCHEDDAVVLFFGDGEMAFPVSQEIRLGEDRSVVERGIRDMAVADLNGDGRLDLALACSRSREVVVLLNESDSGKAPQRFATDRYTFAEGEEPRALAAADLNGDGKTDLAAALWGINEVALLIAR